MHMYMRQIWNDPRLAFGNGSSRLILHLLLFISAKRTFICAKRCINNLYCTFLNTASNIIGAKRLSIAIFKYARAFNSINRQSTKRRDNHLGGTLFHVRAMKIQ